jgi:protein phosphatase
MIYYAKTHTGCREKNEDSLFAPNGADGFFAVVADGMGGHNAGEVASRIVVDTVREMLENADPEIIRKSDVQNMLAAANTAVYKNALENPERIGMGSTATMAVFSRDKVMIGQIGDSRAYHFSNGKIKRITKDHSYVQLLIDSGYISEEDAKHHPQRNIITRAIGTESVVEADIYSISIKNGDTVLLCSDGLCGVLSDDDIASALSESIQTAADRLVDAALGSGGTDNISVVIAYKGGDSL